MEKKNVYAKLQKARVDMQKKKMKKTGKNKFASYEYFELGDFLPTANEVLYDNALFSRVFFTSRYAYLVIYNIENPTEKIMFSSPMADANLKGCHPIQNVGAVETYQRRYLYMLALEIVEHDVLDATVGDKETTVKATSNQLKAIYAAASDKKPDEVKRLLKERYGVDASTKLTKEQASDLLDHLNKGENNEDNK